MSTGSAPECEAGLERMVPMTEEQKNAWGVIGGICNTSWDTDFAMTEVSAGVYESNPLELKAGEEFKVRQGASWDVNFGVEFNGEALGLHKGERKRFVTAG